ncbi:hypothetical protein RZS08_56405, partial [Arthrospira platensis SPKY1]|nr:hypothetical protein [Arthrospira platensis SPKY1]
MKPSHLLLALLGGLLAASLLLGICSALALPMPASLGPISWGLLLTLLGVALLDGLRLRGQPSPRLERQLPGNLPLGRWSEVQLCLHHDYAQ